MESVFFTAAKVKPVNGNTAPRKNFYFNLTIIFSCLRNSPDYIFNPPQALITWPVR